MEVLQQMLIFFLMIGMGIYARKKKILTAENQAQISALVVNIAYPAIILSGAVAEGPRIGGAELANAFLAAVALIFLTMLLGLAIPWLLGYDKKYNSILNVMTIFTNIGFMGVPMIKSLYGAGALIYMTVFLIPFNIMFFSYAINAIKDGHGEKQEFKLTNYINNGMLACFAAIIIYLADIHLPYVLVASINMLGNMTAPLAMMLLGSFLLDISWSETFKDVRIVAYSAIKMLAVPVIVVGILAQFFSNPLLLAVCMAALATPSGNVIPLLAALYNKDVYEISVRGIAITTIISLVTMPIAFSFLKVLGM